MVGKTADLKTWRTAISPTVRNRQAYYAPLKTLANYIHDNGYKAVLLEGNSAEPVWDGFLGAWRALYPKERPPAKIKIPTIVIRHGLDSLLGADWQRENEKKIAKYSGQPVVILTEVIAKGRRLDSACTFVERAGFRKVNAATMFISGIPKNLRMIGGKPIFIATPEPVWSPLSHLKQTMGLGIGPTPETARRILRRGTRIMRKIGARGARK